jgi:hypothetical protein
LGFLRANATKTPRHEGKLNIKKLSALSINRAIPCVRGFYYAEKVNGLGGKSQAHNWPDSFMILPRKSTPQGGTPQGYAKGTKYLDADCPPNVLLRVASQNKTWGTPLRYGLSIDDLIILFSGQRGSS